MTALRTYPEAALELRIPPRFGEVVLKLAREAGIPGKARQEDFLAASAEFAR